MLVQDNDVERATNLNRDHLDYVVEESWRWAMACGSCKHPLPFSCAYFHSPLCCHSHCSALRVSLTPQQIISNTRDVITGSSCLNRHLADRQAGVNSHNVGNKIRPCRSTQSGS